MMKKFIFFLFGFSLLLTGCMTEYHHDVKLSPEFWHTPKQTIMVATGKLPQAQIYMPGRKDLLRPLYINDVTSAELNNFLKKQNIKSLLSIKKDFVKQLRAHHMIATNYKYTIERKDLLPAKEDIREQVGEKHFKYETKNFMSLAEKFDTNQLLLISIDGVGATRLYYGYIPSAPPKALCKLTGRLVDLQDNKVLWRHTVMIQLTVSNHWDQPPVYPNFTKTLQLAMTKAKQALLKDFFSSAKK